MKKNPKRKVKKRNQKPLITDWIATICAIVMALVEVLSYLQNR